MAPYRIVRKELIPMSYVPSAKLMAIVREKVASGLYQSEEHVIATALQLLEDHDRCVEAIKEGLADVAAGRVRGWEESDAEFRAKHGIQLDDE